MLTDMVEIDLCLRGVRKSFHLRTAVCPFAVA